MKYVTDRDDFIALCQKHGSDKHSHHNYGHLYATILGPLRSTPGVKLLEIGIHRGASLRVWQDYLTSPLVVGIDINQKWCDCAPPGAVAFCGKQADEQFLKRVVSETYNTFDVIVDDGSHLAGDVQESFRVLWPHLAVGGVYAVEDLEASWNRWNCRISQRDGIKTPLDWMLDEAKSRTFQHKHCPPPDSSWLFCGEACAVHKIREGPPR